MTSPSWTVFPGAHRPRFLHVNATATGGGVSELLGGLVPAQRTCGVAAGWAVIGGDPAFYTVTKLLHHLLHGTGDPHRLDDPALIGAYRAALRPQVAWFAEQVGHGDVVVLHDPQTLGLAAGLRATGATMIWHCHIGADVAPERGPGAVWRTFAYDFASVDAVITTLPEFGPPRHLVRDQFVVPPAIDPTAEKNRELTAAEVDAVLDEIGLTSARPATGYATVTQDGPMPRDARMVLQVSRWDPLKDMPGVLRCVVGLPPDVHLVLAGTDPTEVSDDPEGLAVLAEVRAAVARLSTVDRRRVHLVTSRTRPANKGALMVNALQRRADVVLQKSLEEGFGLTVTEAMVKGRAVVASDVGGLAHQIVHGDNGLLVDPVDVDGVRGTLVALLGDPVLRRRLGERARVTALERYTMARLVDDYRAVVTATAGGRVA
ncbi:glycosyltransferase [Frankia sp. CiP3]|uniref:glycosyltransferase n=1 Tax=Frankia sp. CiP3 TaxID=2880971 RepID=UPI001EF711A8|nr:glycosyltransferase [Frankia sp. CiP3]